MSRAYPFAAVDWKAAMTSRITDYTAKLVRAQALLLGRSMTELLKEKRFLLVRPRLFRGQHVHHVNKRSSFWWIRSCDFHPVQVCSP
jgi:hypothetical protein